MFYIHIPAKIEIQVKHALTDFSKKHFLSSIFFLIFPGYVTNSIIKKLNKLAGNLLVGFLFLFIQINTIQPQHRIHFYPSFLCLFYG